MIRTQWLIGCHDDLRDAYEVRRQVFTGTLGLCAAHMADSADSNSFLLMAYDGEKPVATGRLTMKNDECSLGCIAVLKEARGACLGDFIVRLMIRKACEMGADKQFLKAPETSRIFFEKLSFTACAEPYTENGVTYITMVHNGDVAGRCRNSNAVL